ESLPAAIAQAVAAAGIEPSISVSADISAEGSLGLRWLIADHQRLMVLSPNGGEPIVELDLNLADFTGVRVDNLVGCQALTAEIGADDQEIVRFSVAEAPRFAKVRAHLDAWRKGEEPRSTGPELKPRYCPKCRQPLSRASSICPRCIDRGIALARLVRYLRPHLFVCIMVAGSVMLASALQLLQPQFGGLLFDRVFSPGTHQGHEAGAWIHWLVTSRTRNGALSQILLLMLGFQIVSTALATWRGRISSWLAYNVVHDIRTDLFTHVQALSLYYFDRRSTGTVLSRITQDTRQMQGFLIDGVENLLDSVIKLAFIAGLLFYENWHLAVLTIVPAPLVVFLATAFWSRIRVYYSRLWHSFERLTATLQDSLGGVRVVLFWSIGLSSLVVYYFGGHQVIRGERSPGEIFQFLGYLGMFYGPMGWISNLFNWFNETLGAAERVWEVMDERPSVPEAEAALALPEVGGAIVFDDVTFGYEPHEPVLHEVSFDVEPGEMIGLVGHSGAGKSTLINLICRFYDVDEGRILIDGHDLRDVSVHDYRRHIGVVLQEPFLFNGTILENIGYGQPGATFEEILSAARAANAHDFITAFADGYDSLVGERGMRLSGGERQRISIARAILHDPQILILDEATASVDTETERQIQEALQRLVRGRTVFAIAHRLSTLRHANRLMVIEKGRVVETGTHDELMAKEDGVYHRLVNMQTELSRITHVGG
ncbi:MAG: ABC transporter ATP-binding protein, partial [Armatimonadetes bacterium]|nr:ABC transporter ATP-binding protein [Armatimonadota bacterium]